MLCRLTFGHFQYPGLGDYRQLTGLQLVENTAGSDKCRLHWMPVRWYFGTFTKDITIETAGIFPGSGRSGSRWQAEITADFTMEADSTRLR